MRGAIAPQAIHLGSLALADAVVRRLHGAGRRRPDRVAVGGGRLARESRPPAAGATSTGDAVGQQRQVAQDHLLLAVDRHPGSSAPSSACADLAIGDLDPLAVADARADLGPHRAPVLVASSSRPCRRS